MKDYLERVRQVVTTIGAGTSLVLATTPDGDSFFTMAEAGAVDGNIYDYVVTDGNDVEIHHDETWTAGTRTFTRGTPSKSRIAGIAGTSKISLSGSAKLRIFESAAAIRDALRGSLDLSDLDDADAALDNLGLTAVGKAVATASDEAAAQTAIGGSTVGQAVFAAADTAAARTAAEAAPRDPQYLVAATNSELPAERVVTDTATIAWDFATGGQAKASLVDSYRQNDSIDRIYQSKLLGDIRRGVNTFATGFKAATDTLRGIDAGTSSNYDATNAAASGYVTAAIAGTTSYANAGGTGNRTASITATTTLTVTGTVSQIVDGTYSESNGFYPTASQAVSENVIKFDFGSGNAKYINEVIFHQQPGDASPRGVWKWQGSNDNSEWTDVSSNQNWVGGAATTSTWSLTPTTTYRYYRLLGVSGNINYYYLIEVEFKLNSSVPAPADTVLRTISQTSDANVSSVRVLIEITEPSGGTAPTLDTDLTVEVTCNNGSNWSSAPLSLITSYGQVNHDVAETADTACTAGTSFAARIKTFNATDVRIYGVSITAR